MARPAINFASCPAWRTPSGVVLLVSLFGVAHALWYRDQLLDQRQSSQQQIESAWHAGQRASKRQVSGKTEKSVTDKANAETERIAASLRRPWEPMLNALQAATHSTTKIDIVLTAIQPDVNAQRLIVSGRASDNPALLAFVQRLQADSAWRTVELMNQTMEVASAMVPSNGATMPLTFQVAAEWKGE